jgi:hypothetical protein
MTETPPDDTKSKDRNARKETHGRLATRRSTLCW